VSIRLIGGVTVVLEIGGLRLLTDPAFDAPGPVPSGTGP
jgi:L-ascorbate metabolism protein UlaG (beta-lactamase superfamily)